LAVVKHHGAPLMISGAGGALRSFRLDGELGPLRKLDASRHWIRALAVVEVLRRRCAPATGRRVGPLAVAGLGF
jgi:hypothetical protein